MATIAVPTTRGVTGGIMGYGTGVLVGAAYRMVSNITGSGLIGGAIAAGGAAAFAKGPGSDAIPVMLGFQAGQTLNIGGNLGGLFGGGQAQSSGGDSEEEF